MTRTAGEAQAKADDFEKRLGDLEATTRPLREEVRCLREEVKSLRKALGERERVCTERERASAECQRASAEREMSMKIEFDAMKNDLNACRRANTMLEHDMVMIRQGFGQALDAANKDRQYVQALTNRNGDLERLRLVGLRQFLEFARLRIKEFCDRRNELRGSGETVDWLNIKGITESNPELCLELEDEGLPVNILKVLSYGAGSVQSACSEVAHFQECLNTDGLITGMADIDHAKTFARCIAYYECNETREKLDKLFRFCFHMGSYFHFACK